MTYWWRRIGGGGVRRLRRTDAGSMLLEAMIAIAVVSIVLVSITAVMVTGTQTSARQRNAQTAVQIATSALDQVQALGAIAVPASVPGRTVNGTEFETTYTLCSLHDPSDATCTPMPAGATPAGSYVRVTATVKWQGNTCPASGCSYESATLLSTKGGTPLRGATSLGLASVGDVTVEKGQEMTPLTLVATGVVAPPVIFSGNMTECGDASSSVALEGSANNAYGFKLDPVTGVISGTPSVVADYCITVTVTDADLNTATVENLVKISSTAPCFVNMTSERQDGATWHWPFDSNVLKPDPTQVRCREGVQYTLFEARVSRGDSPWPTNVFSWDPGQFKCGPLASSVNATTWPKDSIEKDSYGQWRIAPDPMVCVTPPGENTGFVSFFNPRDDSIYCIGIDETRNGVTSRYYVTWTFGVGAPGAPWRCQGTP